jgi:carboxylesterase
MLLTSAEPFFFPGGRTACLLVHGFTGTPKEMRWMGEALAREGHTVLGIRLPGHACSPEDMLRTRWEDWLLAVEDGWHMLRGAADHIFVLGLSMGGVLSLLFASRFPVTGVVAMSTPYSLPSDRRLPFIGFLRYFKPRVMKGAPDWCDPLAGKEHVDYPFYPTLSIIELRDLLEEFRISLPNISAPVLLIHSRKDATVKPDSMARIYERLGSRKKDLLWVDNSNHVITREPDREYVFAEACRWIQAVVQITPATPGC